jgi:hypothetical protein
VLLTRLLEDSGTPLFGGVIVKVFLIGTVWLLPDMFGFLFWETKENWSLYRANRGPSLGPEVIGVHGETLPRLLQPGFHSGTIPRLFARLRQAEREASETSDWRAVRAGRQALHEVERALQKFVERELVALLRESTSWHEQPLSVGAIALASNRIEVELVHADWPLQPVWLSFEDRAGWLVAHLRERGWLDRLPAEPREAFLSALASLYKRAGVELVLEQIQACLPANVAGFDLTSTSLIVWLDHRQGRSWEYDLREPAEMLTPRASDGTASLDGPVLDARRLVFGNVDLSWQEWVENWTKDQDGKGHARLVSGGVEVTLLGEQLAPA